MLFKINNLAILPNSVRADLKGCFVVAEGTGDLSTERVKTRLLTLSCVTKNGESIIDQEVKGFVVDADGQVDLKGEPVAKMGMHLARVGLAGLLGGAAEGIEQSAFVSQFSAATGITEKTLKDDSDAILKLGVGRGVADTAKELKSFYLQLAQKPCRSSKLDRPNRSTSSYPKALALKSSRNTRRPLETHPFHHLFIEFFDPGLRQGLQPV